MVDMHQFRRDLATRFGIANFITSEAEYIAFKARQRVAQPGIPLPPLPNGVARWVEWPVEGYEQDTVDAVRETLLAFARRYQCLPTVDTIAYVRVLHFWDQTNTVLVPQDDIPDVEMPEKFVGILGLTLSADRSIEICASAIEETVNPYNAPTSGATDEELAQDTREHQYRASTQLYAYRNDARVGIVAPRGALGFRALVKRTLLHEMHHFFYPRPGEIPTQDDQHAEFRRRSGWIGPHYVGRTADAPPDVAHKYDVGQPAVQAFVDGATLPQLEAPAPASLDPYRLLPTTQIWEPALLLDPRQPWSASLVSQPVSDYAIDGIDENYCEVGTSWISNSGKLNLRAPREHDFAVTWLVPDVMRLHPNARQLALGYVL